MYDRVGFENVVDLTTAADSAPLADGLWDISLADRVPDLLHALRAADPDYVLLDGTLAECDKRTSKTATQEHFATGSRMATHSTW